MAESYTSLRARRAFATTAFCIALLSGCGRIAYRELPSIDAGSDAPSFLDAARDDMLAAMDLESETGVDADNDGGPDAGDMNVVAMPGIAVSPTSGLTTTEAGASASFTVTLSSRPSAPVYLTLTSSNVDEATASPAFLAFDQSNWTMPQTVFVDGVDDDDMDGDQAFTIVTNTASSADASYDGVNAADVAGTNIDDDNALPAVVIDPAGDLVTNETGTTATFTMVLTSRPTADVTILLSSSDLTEGTVAPASVTFTMLTWNVPQTVTVTGVDDFTPDADIAYSVITSSAASTDPAYAGLVVADVSVINNDDDAPRVAISTSSTLITTELAGTATFTMVLTTQPTDDVTIALSSTNTSEGTVSPSSVTFTPSNWDTPQTVTVTGVNDFAFDGYVAYRIVTAAAVSSDPSYSGLVVSDVNVSNRNVMTYLKASNTSAEDAFGEAVAMSRDGTTIAVGAWFEASGATGVDGNQASNTAPAAGAVYVFVRSGGLWTQQAYIKASNAEEGDFFGEAVALSADGTTLVVGASAEDGGATSINGNQADNSANVAGAAYVFTRSGATWTQQAYIKTSTLHPDSRFGHAVSVSDSGDTVAVGAFVEGSASGIGAAYVFVRAVGVWTQQARIMSSNLDVEDFFGSSVALSADGDTLAAGAYGEQSSATGVGGNEADDSAMYAGAAYVFVRSGGVWTQQAYIKASNTDAYDYFGYSLALSGDGTTLAVGAPGEGSPATGVDGPQNNNTASEAGAVYVFTRSATTWSQQAYVKASNSRASSQFSRPALSFDGNVMAVGARLESSFAIGIGGSEAVSSEPGAGAAYIFARTGTLYAQRAYVKAPNTQRGDNFGFALALSGDGRQLLVSAPQEGSSATGINGEMTNNAATRSGAAYVYF